MTYRFQDLRSIVFGRVFSVNQINSYWLSQIDSDPNMSDVYMTMDFVFGNGHRLSVATNDIHVSDSDGKLKYYSPKLVSEATISSQYNIGDGAASQRSFVVSIDARSLKPMDVVLGGDLLTGFAEISLQVNDGEYDNRYVLMKGDMAGGVVFGADEEPLEFDVVDPKITFDKIQPEFICDEEAFPPASDLEKLIGTENFDVGIPQDSLGQRFPIVMDQYNGGVPCIGVGRNAIIVTSIIKSYRHMFVACLGHEHEITKVFSNGIELPDSDFSVFQSISANGIAYTRIAIREQNPDYYRSASIYAFVQRKDGKNRTVIELIEDIIRTMTLYGPVGVDEELVARAKVKQPTLLSELLINASGENNIASAIEYIESTICSSFPMISMAYTGRGYGPILTDRHSGIHVKQLISGQGELYDRASSVQESSKESLCNSYTIKYGFNAITNNYDKVISVNSSNNVFCKISETRLGLREKEPLDSPLIYDDATAQYVVDWLASHFSLPSYYVEYEGSPSLMFTIMLGDNIILTDSKLGIDSTTCTVEKIEYDRGKLILGLRMWLLYEKLA